VTRDAVEEVVSAIVHTCLNEAPRFLPEMNRYSLFSGGGDDDDDEDDDSVAMVEKESSLPVPVPVVPVQLVIIPLLS
jgi:hypothetical protein